MKDKQDRSTTRAANAADRQEQGSQPAQRAVPLRKKGAVRSTRVKFSLDGSVSDLSPIDRSGKRKPRPSSKPTNNSVSVYKALEPLLSKLPEKYWNNLLELVSFIGMQPALSSDHAGFARVTRDDLRKLATPKYLELIKDTLLDTFLDERGHGIAYKLKAEAIQLLQESDINSLEALREVPEFSGVPNIDPLVPVNLPAIKLGLEVIDCYLQGQGHELLQNEVADIAPEDLQSKLLAVRTALSSIAAEAEDRGGFILQTYNYSERENRYYGAGGTHVQQIPRLARSIVFNGYWDIDINCCHHAILLHLGEEKGLKLPCLAEYVARKAEIRQSVANELEAPMPKVKEALIATINGIGHDELVKLLPSYKQSQTLAALRTDISSAAKSLNVKWNRVGSHLNQWERLAIEAATAKHTSSVAVMHDGYVVTDPSDIPATAEPDMERATGGIKLVLERGQLNLAGFP